MKAVLNLMVVETVVFAAAVAACILDPGAVPSLTAWFALHSGGVVTYRCSVGGNTNGFIDTLCSSVIHDVASVNDLVYAMVAVGVVYLFVTRQRRWRP